MRAACSWLRARFSERRQLLARVPGRRMLVVENDMRLRGQDYQDAASAQGRQRSQVAFSCNCSVPMVWLASATASLMNRNTCAIQTLVQSVAPRCTAHYCRNESRPSVTRGRAGVGWAASAGRIINSERTGSATDVPQSAGKIVSTTNISPHESPISSSSRTCVCVSLLAASKNGAQYQLVLFRSH